MLATDKTLSLIEQKKLQWAKEREEMIGLCGLWGRPRNSLQKTWEKDESVASSFYSKNLLPPIQGKVESEEPKEHYRPEEESETSGYLSDSPKHLNEKESCMEEYQYLGKSDEHLNNERIQQQQQYWSDVDKTENYWNDKKMYKNYKNENWAHHNSDSYVHHNRRLHSSSRNYWHGTPESISSDDGSRLRWGDRGVGIGHLWDPVINRPDSRLPQVADPYRQTPKWVEKGLKNTDGNKADILIIHHPDDEEYHHPQKNYLLGQNVPIPQEIIEERERKRQKALEHQNAIKKQLEEREMRRKQERENRIREERLEEERIKKQQEIDRLRYEDEQRKVRQKEELDRKKEEAMKEAIELAERRAMEDKKLSKRHVEKGKQSSGIREKVEKLEKIIEQTESGRYPGKKLQKMEEEVKAKEEKKKLKDSSSQFEEIQLLNSFQFLNVNGLPAEGGLALMLDHPPKDNSFLLPPDGVQLALLMSPRTANSTNHVTSLSPVSILSGERTLTPSKYRISERAGFISGHKATQTDFADPSSWVITPRRIASRGQKQHKKCGTNSGGCGTSQKIIERHHKHVRCYLSSKHRSKSQPTGLEDRPKWGINRPSVQYKKQSEKDPYYQRKIRERLKKAAETEMSPTITSKEEEKVDEDIKEKELESVVRLLDCQTDEEDKPRKEEFVLQNGYRMSSNLSTPVFIPIGNTAKEEPKKVEEETPRSTDCNSDLTGNEEANDVDEEEPETPGSVAFLSQTQLDAIKQIACLREGLKKLQKDYSASRSITPFSDNSVEK